MGARPTWRCTFGGMLWRGLPPLLHLFLSPSILLAVHFIMADPTKAETEQVFKVLKAQKGNKVRDVNSWQHSAQY